MPISILPGNLPELEQQIESLEQRITDLNIPIAQLWDPKTCPVEALPYLAWAVSVDVWDPDWPENIKRQVIAAAPELHRIKGTPKAIKQALTALNLDYEYSEWHQKLPLGTPGTFNIDVYVDDRGIDLPLIEQTHEIIKNNKRATAHYSLTVNLNNKSSLQLSALYLSSLFVTVQPFYQSELKSSALLRVGCSATSLTEISIFPRG